MQGYRAKVKTQVSLIYKSDNFVSCCATAVAKRALVAQWVE